MKHDFEGTLGKLAAMGFEGVEFAGGFGRYANDPAGLRAFLDKLKLACAGAHLDFAALSDARFPQTTAFYRDVGCRNLVIAWDTIAAGTPQQSILQQDIGWTVFAGKDPVALIRRYPGRTVSSHFKAKLAQGTTGKPLIGQDNTDWPAVYAAARGQGGAEWIVLEQEEYPDGMRPLEAVAASMRGLQGFLKRH
ncbi:sugar phosphate isomerase/epimerase family protein [Massilia aerilata]|uniref:Sugar phosphate isomerase/epimerase family protein n=1 Tax=Massilia aerilata TaxID=453817 RepID=A0ABW0RXA3_9BURK